MTGDKPNTKRSSNSLILTDFLALNAQAQGMACPSFNSYIAMSTRLKTGIYLIYGRCYILANQDMNWHWMWFTTAEGNLKPSTPSLGDGNGVNRFNN